MSAEVTTIWDVVADRQSTARGFDDEGGVWGPISHLAVDSEEMPLGPLDHDQVRGSLIAISNTASWGVWATSCNPEDGREVREAVWLLARRLERMACRLGEEIINLEAEGD